MMGRVQQWENSYLLVPRDFWDEVVWFGTFGEEVGNR
jgi:hypothetical protein